MDNHFLKIAVGFLLAFIPLYPKFPLYDIKHTWVYIRLEDFLVGFIILFWLIQLARKKVSFKTPLTWPIFTYWFIGGVSLLFSLVFLSSKLANFFPNVAILHYVRRIEYMLPFFIAASTIKSLRDVKHYLVVIGLTLLGVIFYGFGQRYLGFPAYLTMNEEFSKGLALYLPPTGRVTSTFGGHYDLAAFLVLMIAFCGSLIFGFKSKILKIGLFILTFFSFILLLLTASRVSFGVYLLAVSFMLYLQKKKWLIIPVILASIVIMIFVSGASERFAKTFRVQRVVYSTKTGQPIAVFVEPKPVVPSKEPVPVAPPPEDSLPLGSGFLTVPILEKTPEATTVATIRRPVVTSLKTASSASEIATISGDFLIRRTIVYDISFTTRFQGEWPRAWEAFKRNPVLGSGYSSISLATDGDYLRALGETGVLGLLSFLAIFFVTILILRRTLRESTSSFEKSVLIGMGAALFGFLLNAILIDVFEASKVAFSFWILAGITVGMAGLQKKTRSSLWQEALEVLRLPVTSLSVFAALSAFVLYKTLGNYFSGDDFTWLKLAVTTGKEDIFNFFLYADGFFYRPLAKTYFTLIQPIFDLKPLPYHFIDFLLHFGATTAVYFIALCLTKRKLAAFLTALFFLIHPIHAESIFWVASTSALGAAFFYLWSFLFYLWWRQAISLWRSLFLILSLVSFALGIFSHEVALTLPLILFMADWLFSSPPKKWLFRFIPILPYILILDAYLWLRVGSGAYGLSGDYSYNWSNLVFNVFGNLWGYLGILVAGEKFIPLYDAGRTFFRLHSFWGGVGIILGLSAIFLFLRQGKTLVKWFPRENRKIYLFALVWFLATLLPFLGLGNLAERYAYLASFAFTLGLSVMILQIWRQFGRENRLLASIFGIVLLSGLSGVYWQLMARAGEDWQKAGETANKILLTISSNYATFPEKTTLYFIDLPPRQERAWVFPVGLKDGLWFIYKDESLQVEKVKDVETAMAILKENPSANIFVFENGELKKVREEEVKQEK